MKNLSRLVLAFALCGASVGEAAARPHYGTRYYAVPDYAVPDFDDEAPPVGLVFMRPSERCEYPNGWNTTDFGRNLNGIPRSGHALLATGCGSYRPFPD